MRRDTAVEQKEKEPSYSLAPKWPEERRMKEVSKVKQERRENKRGRRGEYEMREGEGE